MANSKVVYNLILSLTRFSVAFPWLILASSNLRLKLLYLVISKCLVKKKEFLDSEISFNLSLAFSKDRQILFGILIHDITWRRMAYKTDWIIVYLSAFER